MAYSPILKPNTLMNTKLYTGNGSTNNITGVGFQPDWVWTKCRSTVNSSRLIDAVRGVTKAIVSNSTGAEFTEANGLSAFGTDGYTLNGNLASMNTNSDTYVSWNWKANGAGSANTDGSISSTVSANTTSGFSIVTVANVGSANFTFGHGLGVAPSWVLAKSRDGGKWNNYFKSLGAGYTIQLPETGAKISNTAIWQNTNPTSSVVYSNGDQLDANESYVFYCFAEKQGYSKFGSYTGNGNADGTFVYTGFKPAFVMIKRSDASDSWCVFDNKRLGYNVNNYTLFANQSAAENTEASIDFLSNGFKLRGTQTRLNASNGTYIYMAFAENPFVASNYNVATAR